MKKSRSTRSHFTHARSCSCALNQVPTSAKQPASIRTYSLWKGDIFPFNRFTGYEKSNQNQFGRVLPFAFALTCYKINLFLFFLWFGSFSWRVHLSYGVCRLRARVQLKTLSSFLKGLGKRGHIVADTLLPMMFLGLRKLGNICCGHKMFLNKIRNIFCVPDTKFVSATNVARAGKRGNICVGNNVSATVCPRLPEP